MTLEPLELLNVFLSFVNENPLFVGRLALKNREIWFQYDEDFLQHQLSISPLKLPLKREPQRCTDRCFEGLFGVFNDSLPDGFGRLLQDRHLRAQGLVPETLTPLDRLAFVGRGGMGALTYEPVLTPDPVAFSHPLELDQLAYETESVLLQDSADFIDELLSLNGSSNGARPKVMVGVSPDKKKLLPDQGHLPENMGHWLIKFKASQDAKDIAEIEFAYSNMARAAGLVVPATHLFHGKSGAPYFGIERFDRQGERRLHMHTLSGLLHSDHRIPALDYETLLKATAYLTRDQNEVERAYRLAVFNVLAHNRDDHSKNFAFLMDEQGRWRLSPAYDLTFSYGPGGEQSTTVMGEGKNPGAAHLLKLARLFSLKNPTHIIEEVETAVQQWPTFAAAAGVMSITRVKHTND